MLVDCDAERPDGISSTDNEKESSQQTARHVYKFLKDKGFPDPIFADSGNGHHLLYKVDLPNTDDNTTLVSRFLEAVNACCSNGKVKIDKKVGNAARITKLYGTKACKGEDFTIEEAKKTNTEPRPHRYSKFVYVPQTIEPVSREIIERITKLLPQPEHDDHFGHYQNGRFDLQEFISNHDIEINRTKSWQDGTMYEIRVCPFNPEHNKGEARIIEFSDGRLSFGCFHDSCSQYKWAQFRDKYEPNYKQQHDSRSGFNFDKTGHKEEEKVENISEARVKFPFPSPVNENAYHGVIGELVKAIEPYSEADPVAILVSGLAGFGNIIGDNPHFKVEADKHPCRVFVVLVGDTSKGRKGISWGYIETLFQDLDETWGERIQSGLSTGEGLIYAVRDPLTKQQPIKEDKQIVGYEDVIIDEGISDKRLLVYESEFARTLRVMARDTNILSAIIRQAWDSDNLKILTKNTPYTATGTHISIIGHITRGELVKRLNETETANGFANRFLFLCVNRSKVLPYGGNFQQENINPILQKLGDAIKFAKDVGVITWAQETKPLWEEVYPSLSEGKEGLLGAILARAEANVTRLACIYALTDQSVEIKPEHLKAALAIWQYCEASVKYIFRDTTRNKLTDRIYTLLLEHEKGMTRTDINNYYQKHKSSKEIQEALDLLNYVGIVDMEKLETKGRPVEVWKITRKQPA